MLCYKYYKLVMTLPAIVLVSMALGVCAILMPPATAQGFSQDPLVVTYAISSGTDDSIETISSGYVITNRKSAYPGKNYIIGYRFDGIDVPKGSNIQSAALYQYCAGYEERPVALKYVGEAADASQTFSTEQYDLSSRPKTVGYQLQTDPWTRHAFNASPDLRDIVQEIIDRPGWETGNAITIFVEDHGSESTRMVYHFEYKTSHGALLEVAYAENSSVPGSDNESPVISILNPPFGFETSQDTVTIEGIASDNIGVINVVWESNSGANGVAQGTTSWSIGNINLVEGINTIIVRAYDAAGNVGESSVEINRFIPQGEARVISIPIESADCDSFEKTYNGSNSDSNNVVMIGNGRSGGFRFKGVSIPPGASISSATLMLYCTFGADKPVALKYAGEASCSSLPFASQTLNIGSRLRTAAYVFEDNQAWRINTFNASPDLRDIVQEIVDLPDWREGNPITLFIDDYGSTATRNINAYDKYPDYAAFLRIESNQVADFTIVASANPTVVDLNEPVYFTSEASEPEAVSSFLWNFGDGKTSAVANPTHTYTTEGNYQTKLVVENINGSSYQDSVDVTVLHPPAFEGFGQNATGGYGHTVHTAESATMFSSILNEIKNSGGNAEIKLEGNWVYTSGITLAHLANLTIDGSGSSVKFDGMTLYLIDCENVILEGLRVRNHQTGDDSIQINSCRNVVVDHCSLSEAGDGNLDITGFSYGPSQDITVSYCILADTWKQSLIKYGGTTRITLHHNLFYNGGGRLPSMHEGIFDFKNNVIWQWASYGTTLLFGAKANIVNNWYEIPSDNTRGHAAIWYYDADSKAWIEGNVLPAQETDTSRLSAPLNVPAISTENAEAAKQRVLSEAGAFPRDAYDQQVISNVQNGIFPTPPPYHD